MFFATVYDHVIQVIDLVDTYRELNGRRPRFLHVQHQQPHERNHEGADNYRHDLHAFEFHRRHLWHELQHQFALEYA